jgi:hypothetical protein
MRVLFFSVLGLTNYTLLAQQTNYNTYCNTRYVYCIDYPGFLYPQPEAYNGDGRIFTDKDGIEKLRVWGSKMLSIDSNGDEMNIQASFKYQLAESKKTGKLVSYSKLGKNFFVISGNDGKRIFYQKTIRLKDGYGTAMLTYKEAERTRYNILAKQIFASFKDASVP